MNTYMWITDTLSNYNQSNVTHYIYIYANNITCNMGLHMRNVHSNKYIKWNGEYISRKLEDYVRKILTTSPLKAIYSRLYKGSRIKSPTNQNWAKQRWTWMISLKYLNPWWQTLKLRYLLQVHPHEHLQVRNETWKVGYIQLDKNRGRAPTVIMFA